MTDAKTKVFITDELEQEMFRILSEIMPTADGLTQQGIVDQIMKEDRGMVRVGTDFTRRDAIERIGFALLALHTDRDMRQALRREMDEALKAFTYAQIRDQQQILDADVAAVQSYDDGHQYLNKAWDTLLREPFDQLRLAAADTDESNAMLRRCAHLLYYAQLTQNFVADPTAVAVLGLTFKTEQEYFTVLSTYCDVLASVWRFDESYKDPDVRLTYRFVRRVFAMVIALRDNSTIDESAESTLDAHLEQSAKWLSEYTESQAALQVPETSETAAAPAKKILRRNDPAAEQTQADLGTVIHDIRTSLETGGFAVAPSSVEVLAMREQAVADVRKDYPELHSLGADAAHDAQVEQKLTRQDVVAEQVEVPVVHDVKVGEDAVVGSTTSELITREDTPLNFDNIDWNQHPSNRRAPLSAYPGVDRALARAAENAGKAVARGVPLSDEVLAETPAALPEAGIIAFTGALGVAVGLVTGQFGVDGSKLEQLGELLDQGVMSYQMSSQRTDFTVRFYKLLQAIPADDPATIQRREFVLQFVAFRVYATTGGLEVNLVN